jgi:hypothetical protein
MVMEEGISTMVMEEGISTMVMEEGISTMVMEEGPPLPRSRRTRDGSWFFVVREARRTIA